MKKVFVADGAEVVRLRAACVLLIFGQLPEIIR